MSFREQTRQRQVSLMNDAIITALIMAGASIICQLLINKGNRQKRAIEEAKKDTKLEARLQSIEDKLDTHNQYADKIGGMAIDIAVIKTKIEAIQKT